MSVGICEIFIPRSGNYESIMQYNMKYVGLLITLNFGKISKYRSGTLNSNTVNLKFHLIRSFFQIFARFLSFHV